MKHIFRLIAVIGIILCGTSTAASQGVLSKWGNAPSSWDNILSSSSRSEQVRFNFNDGGRFEGFAFYENNQLTRYSGKLFLPNGDYLQGDFSPAHDLIGSGFYYIKRENRVIKVKSENGQLVQTEYWDQNQSGGSSYQGSAPAPTYTAPATSGASYSNPASSSKTTCMGCRGNGKCQHCHGSGWVNNNKSKCSLCHGTGRCQSCAGLGYVH